MRKDIKKGFEGDKKRKIIYLSCISGTLILLGATIVSMIYIGTLDNSNEENFKGLTEGTREITNVEKASSEIGKSIEEVKKEENEKKADENILVVEKTNDISNDNVNKFDEIKETENVKSVSNQNSEEKISKIEEEKDIEPVFSMPCDGEIIKEFAKDKLVYSNTLKEWVTHLGIDIKADKTSVVKSSEQGTVKSIKNDPRYGLTVVIGHNSGYSTVYSNLLTAEFVVVGEKVEKGQTIGTVGNTANFEIADESHLHFEILKDNVQIDPDMYIK